MNGQHGQRRLTRVVVAVIVVVVDVVVVRVEEIKSRFLSFHHYNTHIRISHTFISVIWFFVNSFVLRFSFQISVDWVTENLNSAR